MVDWFFSLFVFSFSVTYTSFFLIFNCRPTEINSTCNEWKLKSPALCSTELLTSKPLPSLHSSVLYDYFPLHFHLLLEHNSILKQHPLYSFCCLHEFTILCFPPPFLLLLIKFPLESMYFSPSVL